MGIKKGITVQKEKKIIHDVATGSRRDIHEAALQFVSMMYVCMCVYVCVCMGGD